jgi:hypothetical protein
MKPHSNLLLKVSEIQKIRNIALSHTGNVVCELFDDDTEIKESKNIPEFQYKIPNPTIIHVKPEAYEILIEFEVEIANRLYFEDNIEKLGKTKTELTILEIQTYACNRLTELVYRICNILAVCSDTQVVTKEIAQWAIGFILTLKTKECNFYLEEITKLLNEKDKENEEKIRKEMFAKAQAKEEVMKQRFEKAGNSVIHAIQKFGDKGATFSDIYKNSWVFRMLPSDQKMQIIETLIESKKIKQAERKSDSGKSQLSYYLIS